MHMRHLDLALAYHSLALMNISYFELTVLVCPLLWKWGIEIVYCKKAVASKLVLASLLLIACFMFTTAKQPIDFLDFLSFSLIHLSGAF